MKEDINGAYRHDINRYSRWGKLEFQEPSFWVVTVYRYGRWCKKISNKWLRLSFLLTYWPIYAGITLLTGINLPPSVKIGPGLRIWHFGCIVLHPNVKIGYNCDIRHGVTIGNRQKYDDVPKIGNNVNIGAGAMLLGDINIGDNVTIGANSVVISDVPSNHTAVGNPAKIILKK